MRRRLRIILAVPVLLAVLVGVGALRQSADTPGGVAVFDADSASTDEAAARAEQTAPESAGDAFEEAHSGGSEAGLSAPVPAPAPGGKIVMGGSNGGGAASREARDFGADTAAPSVGPLPPLSLNDRIIKDGRVEIEVARGGFDRAYAQVLALAGKVDGTVVQSQSSTQEDQASGEVTIRVPAQRFEDLLNSTGGIGKVEHRSIQSQDVSGEFVDLQSRLRHLQAQERFYLDLMSKARTVGDAVAINQNLSTVQAEMEQVQGRLRLLEERTTYSRLTIALHEPGANPLLTQAIPPQRGVLAQAWADAVHAVQQTVGALLVGAFTLAPLALVALLGWALWRRLRPRPAPTDPQPAAAPTEGPLHVG